MVIARRLAEKIRRRTEVVSTGTKEIVGKKFESRREAWDPTTKAVSQGLAENEKRESANI